MFSETALKILEKRYYLRDKDGNLLEKSPEDLFRRVARAISQAELNYSSKDQVGEIEELFYNVMINQELMPASPILFNAGTSEPMLSSCFGIEVDDSMESILKVLSDSAMIFKKGGGVGWNFSKLRGKGVALSGGGTSSGVCAFIQLYDTMIEAIKQGGKRRGAGAVILDSMHHDILEFIGAKRDGIWSNLNISVICTDEFMSKIDTEYKEIWDEIVKSSWSAGDPNLIFIDSMNRNNSLPKYPINVVNPCHEICMSSYESCNLAGINLDKCLKGNKKNAKIDWDKLGRLVKLGHRFLDNMIDVCKYPLQEIHDFAHKTRRQGLYVFGLAPLLIRLGLRYGSQESLDLIDNLFCFINRVSLESCISLGKERGNFPEFAESTYSKKYKYMRCSNRLTIAPSGTTSRIADSYFSIEPYYAFDYTSNIMDEQIDEHFEIKNEYSDLYPEAIVTAHDLTPEEHLRVMATIQKWVDQSISKTVNVPFSTSQNDLSKIFRLAYKLGLKCISIYRDASKADQVLQVKSGPKNKIKTEISKLLLEDLYIKKELSISQISELLGVSTGIVFFRLKEQGISLRPMRDHKYYRYIPEYDTIKMLHDRGLSIAEISEVLGHHRSYLDKILKENDTQLGRAFERSVPISPLLEEFIDGELLGDGAICKFGGNDKNTRMSYYSHSSKYREYLEWLSSIFSFEGLLQSGNIRENVCNEVEREGYVFSESLGYYYSSIACIELMEIRNRWYPNGEKIVPKDLMLTPTKVRQWFIGDGIRRDYGVDFCVGGFNVESRELLLSKLSEIGFKCSLQAEKEGGPTTRIHIWKQDLDKFYDYVNQSFYIDAPECYQYKFQIREKFTATVPLECRNGVCEI